MVRAAVSGAINYSRADPTDNRWRIRHRLLLLELQRREDQQMLEHMHRHWCAYLGHGGLTIDSFENIKKSASKVLNDLHGNTFPWIEKPKETPPPEQRKENEPEESKIDDESKKMIERFKVWRQEKKAVEKGKN